VPPAAATLRPAALCTENAKHCHSMDAGKNMLGPSLAGIFWDGNTLDAYLADPQKLVPGNKMPFPGRKLLDAELRAAVLAVRDIGVDFARSISY